MAINENRVLMLFLSIIIGITCLFLYLELINWLKAKRLKRRFSKSRQAEKEAEKLLKKKGYTIIDFQKSKPLLITFGDKIHRYLIRIDYLVSKRGKIYVVEVKSGEKTSYITNRETRRQMLEYYLAYQPSGIILLNMKNKSISEVKFQFEKPIYQWIYRIVYFLAGIIFALLLYFLFYGG